MSKFAGLAVLVAMMLCVASPATAGLDFATSWSNPGFSTATLSMPTGGPYPFPVTATGGAGLGPYVAQIDFHWPHPADFVSPTTATDVVIYFGSISSSILLVSIGMSETGFFKTQSFVETIDASQVAQPYHISLSSELIGGIPEDERDMVHDVRLIIALAGGESVTINAIATPEPATLGLFGLGLLGVGATVARRRRNSAKKAA